MTFKISIEYIIGLKILLQIKLVKIRITSLFSNLLKDIEIFKSLRKKRVMVELSMREIS